jgi:hypothetical protein
MSEKLVEGKESSGTGSSVGTTTTPSTDKDVQQDVETSGMTGSSSGGTTTTAASSSSSVEPDGVLEKKKEDEGNCSEQEASSASASASDSRQKLRQKEALWDLFQSECSFLYDHLMVLKNVRAV